MELIVAGAQIPVTRNVESNLKAIKRAIDFAVDESADILLTPEGSLSGYTHEFDQEATRDALEMILSWASGRLGLALGTCYVEEDGLRYDQIRFYDKDGHYLGFHSKILLCSTLTAPVEGEIKYYGVKPLRAFAFKGVSIGGLICNDLWANPCCTDTPDVHLSQQLARMGAKVIFHVVNGDRDSSEFSRIVARNFHESNLRMRARAGRVWIVTADNCFPDDIPCSSPSGIVNPDGNWEVKLPPQGEGFFAHAIDL